MDASRRFARPLWLKHQQASTRRILICKLTSRMVFGRVAMKRFVSSKYLDEISICVAFCRRKRIREVFRKN